MQKVKAEIYLGNIRQNAELFSARLETPLCAVVKANAYGHGAEEVVSALSGVAKMFAVALLEEGISLRLANCIEDILVFTPPTDEEEVYQLSVHHLLATIPDLSTAKLVSSVCAQYRLPLRVHIKVNIGMNRYGMNGSMLGKVCKFLQRDPYVQVEGVYAHLSGHTPSEAEEERQRFLQMERIVKRYFSSLISHLGATYGAMLGKKYAFDMIRIGLGLYGYLPQGQEEVYAQFPLKKGMQVYAKAITSRVYSFGNVGYGKGEVQKGEKLSVCRVGYADGFLRTRQNGLDEFEKQPNNLCMDVCIRKGKLPKGKWIPIMTDAARVAELTNTIPYEVLCAATRRATFVYVP